MKPKTGLSSGALLCALASIAVSAYGQTQYTFVTFTVPGSTYTGTFAIDEKGNVTGDYGAPTTGAQTGFLRTVSGEITTIQYPGATSGGATGMNNYGVIAGSYSAGNVVGGFFYRNGNYKNITVNGQPALVTDINDYGFYVGNFSSSGSYAAFVVSPSGQATILEYPGGYSTLPYSIKNSGEIIGTYQDIFGNLHTFLYNAYNPSAGYKTIAIPGLPAAQIGDFNSSGALVGGYFNGVTVHGFVYQKGKFQIVEPPGANDSSISAINNNGLLVGSYTTPGSMYMAFIATPVPGTTAK
jgi:hypothetical protein